MKYIGLDLGTKTLGIAISDNNGIIALPYEVFTIDDKNYKATIEKLKGLIIEEQIQKIVLGLPKNMNNTIGERALKTLDFKEMLEKELNLEVIMQDERLSTVSQEKFLISNNVSRKKRKQVIDKMAAQVILQSFLDSANKEKEN